MTARQVIIPPTPSDTIGPEAPGPDATGRHPPSRSLRQQMRHNRRQLSIFQQHHAARRLYRRISRRDLFHGARHIAFYLANDGEISTRPLLQHAWRLGKICYLPVMHPLQPGRLLFVKVDPATRLYRNRWGIYQPRLQTALIRHPEQLDLVIVPLVAFDEQGGRVGMGKGYYDRCFDFRRERVGKPFLLGVAHEEQKVAGVIQPAPWDVLMDAVATPSAWYQCRPAFKPGG